MKFEVYCMYRIYINCKYKSLHYKLAKRIDLVSKTTYFWLKTTHPFQELTYLILLNELITTNSLRCKVMVFI